MNSDHQPSEVACSISNLVWTSDAFTLEAVQERMSASVESAHVEIKEILTEKAASQGTNSKPSAED